MYGNVPVPEAHGMDPSITLQTVHWWWLSRRVLEGLLDDSMQLIHGERSGVVEFVRIGDCKRCVQHNHVPILFSHKQEVVLRAKTLDCSLNPKDYSQRQLGN